MRIWKSKRPSEEEVVPKMYSIWKNKRIGGENKTENDRLPFLKYEVRGTVGVTEVSSSPPLSPCGLAV